MNDDERRLISSLEAQEEPRPSVSTVSFRRAGNAGRGKAGDHRWEGGGAPRPGLSVGSRGGKCG
jgi:hypothetical protein